MLVLNILSDYFNQMAAYFATQQIFYSILKYMLQGVTETFCFQKWIFLLIL